MKVKASSTLLLLLLVTAFAAVASGAPQGRSSQASDDSKRADIYSRPNIGGSSSNTNTKNVETNNGGNDQKKNNGNTELNSKSDINTSGGSSQRRSVENPPDVYQSNQESPSNNYQLRDYQNYQPTNERRVNYYSPNRPENQPGYRSRNNPQRASYVPIVRSFQAMSYVHDDLPAMIFFREGNGKTQLDPSKMSQTSTVTENSNILVNEYFDEHDVDEQLTKREERIKIFYGGNYDLAPIFKNLHLDEENRKKQNRFFKYFKTQRGNSIRSRL